jgi:hypothetical protein
MVRKRWDRLGIAPAPLNEVWAPLPTRAPLSVPLAKPSHGAAFCGGLHGWHLSRHLIARRPYKQKDETRTGAKYHSLAHRPDFVTFRHNRLATMESPRFRRIVTILHNRPPTMETSEIVEIVTILHNPEISGLCALTHKSMADAEPVRMRIIIILRGG